MKLFLLRILLGLSLFTEILCTDSAISQHKQGANKFITLKYSVGTFKFWRHLQYFTPIEPVERKSFSVDLKRNGGSHSYVLTADGDEINSYSLAIRNVDDTTGKARTKDLLFIRFTNDQTLVSKPSFFTKSENSELHKIVYNPNDLDVKFPLMRGKKWVNIKMKGKKEGFRLYYGTTSDTTSGTTSDITSEDIVVLSFKFLKDGNNYRRVERNINLPKMADFSSGWKLKVVCTSGANEEEQPLLSFTQDKSDHFPTMQLCRQESGKWKLYDLELEKSKSDKAGIKRPNTSALSADEGCVGVVPPVIVDTNMNRELDCDIKQDGTPYTTYKIKFDYRPRKKKN